MFARPPRPTVAALFAAAFAAPAALAAQAPAARGASAAPPAAAAPSAKRAEVSSLDAPKVLHACYVPNSGTTYRIKEANLKQSCSAPTHVEFSWTDGAGAAGGAPSGAAAGDLAGSYPAPSVAGLRGRALADAQPASGDVLAWNGSAWAPAAAAQGAPLPNAGGDASGALTALTVTGLQGRSVLGTAPASGNVLAWNGAAWAPAAPAAGGGAFALPYAGAASSAANTSLFKVTQQDAGFGGEFVATGSGVGVKGASLGNAGVYGVAALNTSTSAGVRAEHAAELGTALEISKGIIKVKGAGLNTNTAVFMVDVSPKEETSILDHPLLNGKPNRILFIAYNDSPFAIGTTNVTYAVDYRSDLGRWAIRHTIVPDLALMRFNVLVIVP